MQLEIIISDTLDHEQRHAHYRQLCGGAKVPTSGSPLSARAERASSACAKHSENRIVPSVQHYCYFRLQRANDIFVARVLVAEIVDRLAADYEAALAAVKAL